MSPEELEGLPEIFGVHQRNSDRLPLDTVLAGLIEDWPPSDSDAVKADLLDAVKTEQEPVVFEPAVEILVGSKDLRQLLGVDLVDALIQRATPSDRPREGYMAAIALTGLATILLPDDLEGRRLNAAVLLRDAPVDVDVAWAQAAVQVAGLAYAHWDDSLRESLRTALERLAKHPEAGSDAEAEQAYTALFDAVAATDRAKLESALETAETRFAAVARVDEERIDARLMTQVVSVIRSFGFGGDPASIEATAKDALQLWRERGMYGRPEALPRIARQAAEAAWGRLVDALAQTAGFLDAPIWVRGADAVGLLVDAVETAAAVPMAPGNREGAQGIVVPRIEDSLARNMWQRRMVAAVLDEEGLGGEQNDIALELLENASGAADSTISDSILDVLGEDAEPLRTALGAEGFKKFCEKAQLRLNARSPQNRDGQWIETYNSILASLQESPDFDSDRRQRISDLIGDLLSFLKRCIQAQLNFGSGHLKYLGDPEAKEGEMADHLRSYLEDIAEWSVSSEVPEEGAGGRVDLRVAMGADRFVIECKRDGSPVTQESVGKYLAQTERYLGASLRIAALVILDLTPKNAGAAPSLDNSAWVSEVPPPSGRPGAPRKVVCFVVPGNRAATPSEIGRGAARKPR